jgi:hypothetical protein
MTGSVLGLCATFSVMPKYDFFILNKRSRVKYPKSFYLPDIAAARQIATRIARVFGTVIPQWDDLSYDQQNTFAVQAVDETGHIVLTLPFMEAEQLSSLQNWDDRLSEHKEVPPGLLH